MLLKWFTTFYFRYSPNLEQEASPGVSVQESEDNSKTAYSELTNNTVHLQQASEVENIVINPNQEPGEEIDSRQDVEEFVFSPSQEPEESKGKFESELDIPKVSYVLMPWASFCWTTRTIVWFSTSKIIEE